VVAVSKPDVTIYLTAWCGWCTRAKSLLRSKGVEIWTEIDVESLPGGWRDLTERTGGRTVPQIYVGEQRIGGYDDLAALERAGKLDALLEA
jgi:glutaredoxin 3